MRWALAAILPAWQRWGSRYFGWLFFKSVPEGAATTCYVATSPDLVGVRGFYFADCNAHEGETPYTYDDAMAKKRKARKASQPSRSDKGLLGKCNFFLGFISLGH